jgi:ABC-type nitrate/sulfonate/bicarbonate transport system substrate-binding protein
MTVASAFSFSLQRVLLVCVGVFCCLNSAWSASIRVGVATSPLSTPFYVAEKNGYFRDEGLDLVLIDYPSGDNALTQLLDNKVQFATASDLPIMFRSFGSVPFVVLATFAVTSNDAKLLTSKSTGIRSSKDLSGKRVALVRGTSGQYLLDLTLLAAGLDPRSVTVVDLDIHRLKQASTDPNIDAFSLFQPSARNMLKQLGSDAVVIPIPRLFTLTFNLITLRDRAGISGGEQDKVLRALDRAMQYIKAEPSASMRILQDRLKMEASDVAELWPEYRFALTLNQSLIASLEATARWAIQEELVKAQSPPNYLDFIDVKSLKRVRPAQVTVVK